MRPIETGACASCRHRAQDFPAPRNFRLYESRGKKYCYDCFLSIENIEGPLYTKSEEEKAALDHRGRP